METLRANLVKMGRLTVDQVETALACFHARDLVHAEELIERDDVIDNLNMALEERCFDLVASGGLNETQRRLVRATVKVGINLERSADAGTHIAKRVRLMARESVQPAPFDFREVEHLALLALQEATDAFLEQDLDLAHRACLREPELDARYVVRLEELTRSMLADRDRIPYLMHCASVLKYLEKVADYALNIGEQAIFAITGRRLKFAQSQELDQLIGEPRSGDLRLRPFWDGISGALAARVEGRAAPAVYKEGSRRKILEEADALEAWQRIAGDLTPRVLGIASARDRQALLREYVEGTLLSDHYLSSAPVDSKLEATRHLFEAMRSVWTATLAHEAPMVDYVEQIRRRLPAVFVLHPELTAAAEGGEGRGLDGLLAEAEALQPTLVPQFSVWLHGDFNANNILYDTTTGRVKFIDVHRSKMGDYLEDIGVFLVSMTRRSDVDPRHRGDLAEVNACVEEFASRFARDHGDPAFPRRLRLSVARSLITSARVVIDPALAQDLLRQGLMLLRQLVDER